MWIGRSIYSPLLPEEESILTWLKVHPKSTMKQISEGTGIDREAVFHLITLLLTRHLIDQSVVPNPDKNSIWKEKIELSLAEKDADHH